MSVNNSLWIALRRISFEKEGFTGSRFARSHFSCWSIPCGISKGAGPSVFQQVQFLLMPAVGAGSFEIGGCHTARILAASWEYRLVPCFAGADQVDLAVQW